MVLIKLEVFIYYYKEQETHSFNKLSFNYLQTILLTKQH